MSTVEGVPAAADSRYTDAEKFPAHLGEDPSEEALKALFGSFGWVWLNKVINKSSNTVKFYNPWKVKGGEIAPGATGSDDSKGYIPFWNNPRRYEITYYNKAFGASKEMLIKDLEHYLLSFEQDAVDEDIRAVNPPATVDVSLVNLTINDTGYEIYDVNFGRLNSRLSFHAKP